MPSKTAKLSKKENTGLTLQTITALLEQHQGALVTKFTEYFNMLDSKCNQLQLPVEDHDQSVILKYYSPEVLSQHA